MHDYIRIIRYVRETPWALRPETLGVITELLAQRADGLRLSRDEIEARIGAREPRRGVMRSGAVAVIPIHGMITYRAGMFTDVSGATSIEALRNRFRSALADDTVQSILLHVDSPGGSVDGVAEMAEEIRNARGQKLIAAVADTLAASAAYWLASQADEVAVTPSGEVGSIGVYAAHRDRSEQLARDGIKTTLIKAGRYKAEGNPFEPLTEEARDAMQARVDDYYRMFTADVAAGRRVPVADVRAGYGEGRTLGAQAARAAGLVDRVATFEQTLERLAGGRTRPRPATAARRDPREFAFL